MKTSGTPALPMASLDRKGVIRAIVRSQPNFVARLYSKIRFQILRQRFLEEIAQYLPATGDILDFGCGFGLFALYYALTGPERRVTGVDLNPARIDMARSCASALSVENAHFEACNALDWRGDRVFDAVYMLDLVHHLPRHAVPEFLRDVRDLLRPGGRLLLKDVADRPHYKRLFTLALDRLMIGFKEPIHYWPPSELVALLQSLGFDVKRHPMNDYLPYPHIFYICTRVERDDADV